MGLAENFLSAEAMKALQAARLCIASRKAFKHKIPKHNSSLGRSESLEMLEKNRRELL